MYFVTPIPGDVLPQLEVQIPYLLINKRWQNGTWEVTNTEHHCHFLQGHFGSHWWLPTRAWVCLRFLPSKRKFFLVIVALCLLMWERWFSLLLRVRHTPALSVKCHETAFWYELALLYDKSFMTMPLPWGSTARVVVSWVKGLHRASSAFGAWWDKFSVSWEVVML